MKRHPTVPTAGFTLAELMVVITILALLATFVVKNVWSIMPGVKLKAAKSDIVNIVDTIDSLYRFNNNNRIPESLQELVDPDVNGQTYLKGQTEVPRDPWGNEYYYEPQGNWFLLGSAGPDEDPDTDDDITNQSVRDRGEQG